MEWTVVTVCVALAGLFVTVGRPVVELNRSITRLTTMLDVLAKRLDRLEADNRQTHARLWDRLDTHEKRLQTLEKEE